MNFCFQHHHHHHFSCTWFVHSSLNPKNQFILEYKNHWDELLFCLRLTFWIQSKCKCNLMLADDNCCVTLVTCDCSLYSMFRSLLRCLRAKSLYSIHSIHFGTNHIWVYWFDDMEKLRTKQRKRLNEECWIRIGMKYTIKCNKRVTNNVTHTHIHIETHL